MQIHHRPSWGRRRAGDKCPPALIYLPVRRHPLRSPTWAVTARRPVRLEDGCEVLAGPVWRLLSPSPFPATLGEIVLEGTRLEMVSAGSPRVWLCRRTGRGFCLGLGLSRWMVISNMARPARLRG